MSRAPSGWALSAGTAVAAALVVAAADGLAGALVTLGILLAVGVVTVSATRAMIARRERVGGLRRHARLLGLLIAGELVLGIGGFIALMFVSPHDALLTVLVVVDAAVLAAWAAGELGRRSLAEIDAIRATLAEVGDGRRDVRTGVRGSDEVASLAAAVDAMVAMLDGEERARRTLIAGVSHDLRTPITALRLLAEAIDDDIADDATRRRYAGRMGTHLRSLGALIDDLFELTRLESGDLAWSMEQIHLDELVAEAVAAMQPAADERMVMVSATPATARALVRANPEKVQRVLVNLIQNAIRHTPADGTVMVHTEAVGDAVEVEVADTGAGIPEEHRERIFEPFFRGDSSRTEEGAGLGLAISRAIVEAHGGRIWFERSDVGARVRFRLPAAA